MHAYQASHPVSALTSALQSALDQIQLSHLFVDCSADSMSELQQRILLSVGQSNLIYDGNQTLSIRGKHPILVPLAAPSSTQIGALCRPLCMASSLL